MDYELFDLGNVRLLRGATLRDAKLAYKTYGWGATLRKSGLTTNRMAGGEELKAA